MQNSKTAVPFYVFTLILSAFMLFSVEPMFTKMILPLLGGSPSVWNIAMVFFQAMLLGGYGYAHITSRHLGIRAQTALHFTLLAGCALCLPPAPQTGLHPSGSPALWQIGVMLTTVGAPFFILSASAPLLQHWFAATTHKDAGNPYFLYAASNIGSMAALLSYPTLVEPNLSVHMQTVAWSWGYGLLAVLMALCVLFVWNRKAAKESALDAVPVSAHTKLAWMTLAFIPSSLMLGVTTYITTDLAAIPLLWVAPLSLYLLTFIFVFARKPWVRMDYTVSLFTALLALTLMFEVSHLIIKSLPMLGLHLALFFFAALLCHKKLADLRPRAEGLTAYFMYMSLGGVLGGLFNALVAPMIFVVPLEYALALCAAVFVRGYAFNAAQMRWPKISSITLYGSVRIWIAAAALASSCLAWETQTTGYYLLAAVLTLFALMAQRSRPLAFAITASVFLLANSPVTWMNDTSILALRRNFFGVLQVSEDSEMRNFLHGTTLHGAQPLDPKYRLVPMTYYNPLGPVGDIFSILDTHKTPQRVGVLGLGTGSIACYNLPGRSFDYFEIDPDVVKIAEDRRYFTYLSDCHSPYTIHLGDGRLSLAAVPDGTYDALILDAFSSDNIPMHLMTLDAFRLYMRKVKPGGMIIMNISNRFLNLEPQLAALSASTAVPLIVRHSAADRISRKSDLIYTNSLWAVFTPNAKDLIALRNTGKWHPVSPQRNFRVWTDDYANIVSSFWFWYR